MKREFVFLSILVLVLSLSFISSFDIPISKSSYAPMETMQVEIPNAFIDTLKLSNVLIYSKNAAHSSPVQSNLIKYDNKYHFYAVLPKEPGEYSLRIENTKYWEGSTQSEAPIITNFTIVQTNSSYLSISPGYVYTSNSFSINIQAFNQDQTVDVELPEINFKESFNMGYGDTKVVYFNVNNVKEQINSNIKINDYSIPVVILSSPVIPVQNTSTPVDQGDQSLKDLIAYDIDTINGTILPNLDYYYRIVIVNKDKNVPNIKVTTSTPEITVSPSFIESLYKEQIINITIHTKAPIDGYVRLETNYSAMTFPIKLELTDVQQQAGTNTPSVNEEKTCIRLGGITCVTNEKCSGSRTSSVDSPTGNCCIGNCSIPNSSTSYWIWGILILAVLGFAGWFLYQKANKGEGPEVLQKMFSKNKTDYTQRMNPQFKPQLGPEVRRSLDKI